MHITFRIHYFTDWGQRLFVSGNIPALGEWAKSQALPLTYLGEGVWEGTIQAKAADKGLLSYKYFLESEEGAQVEWEWGDNRFYPLSQRKEAKLVFEDNWRSFRWATNAYYTSAFSEVISGRSQNGKAVRRSKKGNVSLRIRHPHLAEPYELCLTGNDPALGNWDPKKAVRMKAHNLPLWEAQVSLAGPPRQIEYKFGIYDPKQKQLIDFESGHNRAFYFPGDQEGEQLIVHTEEGLRDPGGPWKGAGVAMPVFALRSKKSWGVGEFMDLKLLVDWAETIGMKMVQILPINDTTATHTWVDSYPYAAISVFALHPLYLQAEKVGKLASKSAMAHFRKQRKVLNELPEIDYDGVMNLKWDYLKALYKEVKDDLQADEGYKTFITENREWLIPYAAFALLRDEFGTPDFLQWEGYEAYDREKIYGFLDPKSPHSETTHFHCWLQYHLHLQLTEVATYARKKGIVLKGDIPIGIYRNSVDAWMAPHLYNMAGQAGAPPDDFAIAGQNWGFPTYNWDRMAEDGYAWWRQRMAKMAAYFDAYRIDHILGFFRIWEIPYLSVQGLLGHFNPSMPFSREELAQRGLWMDEDRYCRPYIREHMLQEYFGKQVERVREEFFVSQAWEKYTFKPGLESQRKILGYLTEQITAHPDHKAYYESIREGLLSLVGEVLFFRVEEAGHIGFNPRIALHFTRSYQELDGGLKETINRLYNEYFYHRHEHFWRDQAMVKLPAIKAATNMLVCGEDLGIRWISRLRMPSSSMTPGTQSGTMPKSSPH
ncbi:MAG: 4-alpha-glucanotransferase, partial [Bacteroidota bacterium]